MYHGVENYFPRLWGTDISDAIFGLKFCSLFAETMADWLHCNTCFCQPGEGTKFLLTNCGHMYCEECMEKMSGNLCLKILRNYQVMYVVHITTD